MSTDRAFDVSSFINSRRIGTKQYAIVLLCGLVMFLDGFDTQSISYMAPSIAKEWDLPKDMLGPIFSSALVGLMIGYSLISPLSDRYGHRKLIIFGTLTFAVLTYATIFVDRVAELIALRFFTGIALGSVVPSAIALTTEFSPARLRATFVLSIYCGFSLGFVAAGVVAAWAIPDYGWRSLLWIGSAAPLLVAIFARAFLPESIDFQIRSGFPSKIVWGTVRKLDPSLPVSGPTQFKCDTTKPRGAIGSLFADGRATGTILIWLVFSLNLAEFYALQSWLPLILGNAGYPTNIVALATSMTTVGGIVAAFVIGPAMDRLGAYGSLAIVYFSGTLLVAAFGYSLGGPAWLLIAAAFLAGFCISGGQKSVIALAAIFYPNVIRSTGVGWALGVGRLGGIAGPLLIGALLANQMCGQHILFAASFPMLLAAGGILLLGRFYAGGPRL